MNQLTDATAYDVAVAFFVLLNTALLAWGNYQRTKQNAAVAAKVEEVKREATAHHNGHPSDDA
jgi:hypothetical protein